MECLGVRVLLGAARIEHRGEIGAAAEPRARGYDEAGVHVHGRDVRVHRMRDDRDAGGPEPRILGGARNVLAQFGRELAVHGRDVNADLLEQAAVHQRHHAAATGRAGRVRPVPRRAHEAARGLAIKLSSRGVLERLERAQMSSRSASNQARARALRGSSASGVGGRANSRGSRRAAGSMPRRAIRVRASRRAATFWGHKPLPYGRVCHCRDGRAVRQPWGSVA